MSQPDLVTAITIASLKRRELLNDMKATNSAHKNDPIPHQDDLANWLLENERYQKLSNGDWDVSRTNVHEASAALRDHPTL